MPKLISEFWLFQLGGWIVYGIILILSLIPFAGESDVIINRVALGLSGFAGTFVLHIVCRRQWRRGFHIPRSLFVVLAWCVGLTYLCSAVAFKIQHTFGRETRPFSFVVSLAGITTAGFIFVSWSALYFGVKHYQSNEREHRRALAAERSARESELRALRYQINPHFLFNTLNAISTLIISGQRERAASMVTRLADFFRATLSEQTGAEVSLEDELFLTTQYLEIERIRLGDRLKVEISVNPNLQICRVPHLILQPLIENAIRHGIAPRRGRGSISIHAQKADRNLLIKIADDGLGKHARAESGNGRAGIGLANVNRRLSELYGDSASLDLNWPHNGGCEAVLTIPYHTN